MKRFAIVLAGLLCGSAAAAQTGAPDSLAAGKLAEMTEDEKLAILQGYITPLAPADKKPSGIPISAGFVPGVPRVKIPALVESDASLGVANMGGFMRAKDEATAMPSALAMGATWNPDLIGEAGRIMGAEARSKGFNVFLAGGINLVREARNGRNFEYFSEDPLLTGVLGGRSVKGIQSNNIVSTVKHYLLNAQETGRAFADVRMTEGAMRESDLLAFQIAMEIGDPGSVMCSYNKVNEHYACENSFLLNDVLRKDWGFKGWVMSDWGAVHSVSIREGLDQESGTRPQSEEYFGHKLRDALAAGTVKNSDVDRAVLRILRTMYARGLMDNPVGLTRPIDFAPHLDVAQRVAEQGIVLLKNEGDILPLANTVKSILVVGGHADIGVPQGGGSSQVWPVGGASLSLSIPGDAVYHRRLYMPSSPLTELRAQFPGATVVFDDGKDPSRAATAARAADIAIVFAEQFTAEAHDVLSLTLPDNQDTLINTVAQANPRTAVVLETGGPVTMPWLDRVPVVLQAWYAGNRGGRAIARILSGAAEPSGRLPVTFPADVAQTPNPVLPGSGLITLKPGTDLYDMPKDGPPLVIEYPEGSDVGYRWFARAKHKPLFPFGYGLTYTRFQYSAPKLSGDSAQVNVANVGKRRGTAVAQIYLTERNGEPIRRLVGFQRIELAPGERKSLHIAIDPRLLAQWQNGRWSIASGSYAFAAGENATDLGRTVRKRYGARIWADRAQ